MQKKVIIFDLDGTLINTVADLNTAVNFSLEKHHYPTRSIEQTTRDIGNGVAKLIERSVPNGRNNKDYEICLSDFKAYYREHYFDKSKPYPGIKELLEKLKKSGYRLAVVSNKFNEGVNKLIKTYFPDMFDVIQGEDKNFPTKPNPTMMNHVISALGYTKADCLYIGDTEVDYESAKNAGIDVVLVAYGYRNMAFLQENLKDAPVIETPLELLDLLVE